MSNRDTGSYIGHNRVTTTSQDSASGIWSLAAVERRMRAAAWPVRPVDPNFSLVSLLLRGEGGQLVDASPRTKTFTLGGSVAFSSAQSRFGGGSAYLPGGASDKITVASTADFAFGTGDFTVEFFYYYTPVNSGEYRLTSFGGPANQFANLASGWIGTGLSLVNESVSHFISTGSGPTANQWDHIAYERYNGNFYLYLNGVLRGSGYENINTPTTGLEIYGQGYIDQFRVTKSVARYQGQSFTPPTDQFPDESPPPPAEQLSFAAAYQGASTALPQGNTSGNAYLISGEGTSASPLSLVIGGNDNCLNRVWVQVNQTGTLNWTVTSSSEGGYDYGRLYKHSGPVNTTTLSPNDSVPAGFTAISDARSGETSASGTASVTAGEFLVLAYQKDDSADAGSDTVTLSAYIS